MRKLTYSAPDAEREGRRMSRMVPVLASAVAVGMALTLGAPVRSGAETPRQVCSASVERGRISAYTSTTRTSRLFRTPLLEADRYLQISLPNEYMRQVGQAAAGRPESERQAFIADVMQKNVSSALTALGSNRSAAFECAQPTPTAPAVAPSAPAQPARQPTAPSTTAPPAPQPAPAQDGGAPATDQRRRVIQPGGPAPAPSGKASPAPSGKTAPAVAVQAPIPPARKGGKGTDSEPYVIEVPVPSKRAAGSELYREKFSYTYTGAAVSEKIYITLRFAASSGTGVTSKAQLVSSISPLASHSMREALKARHVDDAPSSGSLVASIGAIVGNARKNDSEVRAYAAE